MSTQPKSPSLANPSVAAPGPSPTEDNGTEPGTPRLRRETEAITAAPRYADSIIDGAADPVHGGRGQQHREQRRREQPGRHRQLLLAGEPLGQQRRRNRDDSGTHDRRKPVGSQAGQSISGRIQGTEQTPRAPRRPRSARKDNRSFVHGAIVRCARGASQSRAVAAAALAGAGLELYPALEVASSQSLKRALAGGGFALMSRLALTAEVQAGTLQVLSIRDLDLSRELRAVRDARRRSSPGTAAFWRWLTELSTSS